MDWSKYFEAAFQNPGGQFLLGVLVLVFGSTSLLSEKTAKEKFGVFGLVSRWWRRRQEIAAAKEQELAERPIRALWEEIHRMEQELHRMEDESRRVTQHLEEKVRRLEESDEQKHAYIVELTSDRRTLELWAAENGLVLPVPFVPFLEWLSARRAARESEEDEESERAE